MKTAIGNALKPLAEAIFGLVNAIPMWAVRAGVFGLLLLLAIWLVSLPPQLPEGREGEKGFSPADLRVFGLFVLALQAVLYLVF